MRKPLSFLGIILGSIALILASWALIHLLAIFGVFLAVAYPILTFAAQKSLLPAVLTYRNIFPDNAYSVLKGSLLILFFTVLSGGIIFGESIFLDKLGFPAANKTVSFEIPEKGQFRLGEVFPMKIEISGIKVPINTVQADIGFDPDKLEVVDLSTSSSFANIFVQKEINNAAGHVRLTGGLAHPGYFSDRGTFATVIFKSKSPGVVKIQYLPTSMVLADDGHGSNVLKDFSSVSYLILPERITSEEKQLQDKAVSKLDVLGTETDRTQLIFYDENKVLGAATQDEKSSFSNIVLENLSRLDKFILSQSALLLNPH